MAETTDERLAHLATLQKDWDSYGADAPWPDALAVARRLVELFRHPPVIIPCSDGGVQLEWYMGGFEIEIAIQPRGQIGDDDIYLLDKRGGEGGGT